MSNTIRGLTIEISADAKNFNSQIKQMTQDIKYTTEELKVL